MVLLFGPSPLLLNLKVSSIAIYTQKFMGRLLVFHASPSNAVVFLFLLLTNFHSPISIYISISCPSLYYSLYVLFEGYSLLWYIVGFGVLSGCDISSSDGFGVLVLFSYMSNGVTICGATGGIHTVDPSKRILTTATVIAFLTMSSSSTLLRSWTRRRRF